MYQIFSYSHNVFLTKKILGLIIDQIRRKTKNNKRGERDDQFIFRLLSQYKMKTHRYCTKNEKFYPIT